MVCCRLPPAGAQRSWLSSPSPPPPSHTPLTWSLVDAAAPSSRLQRKIGMGSKRSGGDETDGMIVMMGLQIKKTFFTLVFLAKRNTMFIRVPKTGSAIHVCSKMKRVYGKEHLKTEPKTNCALSKGEHGSSSFTVSTWPHFFFYCLARQ